MKRLNDDSGAKAINFGAEQPAIFSAQENAVMYLANRMANEHLKNLPNTFAYTLQSKFADVINHTPNKAERLKSYSQLLANVLSAGARVQLAETYAASFASMGVQVTSQSLTAGKPVNGLDGQTINLDALKFSVSDGIAFTNNIRSLLSEIFVDNRGETNQHSEYYINRIMKNIEKSMQKNTVFGVNSAVMDIISRTETLSAKFQEFIIKSGLASSPDLVNQQTKELKKSPAP